MIYRTNNTTITKGELIKSLEGLDDNTPIVTYGGDIFQDSQVKLLKRVELIEAYDDVKLIYLF